MTAPETRWTADTEELVAASLRQYNGVTWRNSDCDNAAESILKTLADAGLLLPLGSTTRVQYGTVRPGFVAICSKTTANKVRSVYTGPWIEVSS